jgi:two-component sensor histidine kinase/PAS domain-containing protein
LSGINLQGDISGLIPGKGDTLPDHGNTKNDDGRTGLQSAENTSGRETKDDLQACGSRLQGIMDSSPIPQFVIDRDHRILYWNRALEHYSGIRANDVVGTTQHWKAFYPGERPCMADLLVDGIVETIPQWYEGKYRKSPHVDGAYDADDFFPHLGKSGVWLHFTAALIKDDTGTVTGAVETLEDITDKKLAELELRRNESRLHDIIHGSPIPQFVIDRDHRILYWNRALEHYSGIRANDVVGTNQHWKAFYPGERPCMADLLVDGMMEKIPQWYEGKYRKSPLVDSAYDATDYFPSLGEKGTWLYFTAALIKDAGGKIMGSVETLEDITERKDAEEKILAQLNEKTVLLREIHHRVKNNLQIIISLLNLQSRFYIGDEVIKNVLLESQNRVKAMSFVHEKLYQAKDISQIDFYDYVQFLVSHLFATYGVDRKKIHVTIGIHDLVFDLNTAIPVGLILNELISNTLQHAFPDGREGEITLSAHAADGAVLISVSDNGIGLTSKQDWRELQTLGLKLVISLVDQLAGTIELAEGEGTTFNIKVPR